MFIGDWMGRGATYWPERTAVVDVARGDAGRFSYRQMNERANRLARWLAGAGVGEGDRVALLAHNGVEYLDALFACGKLGAQFAPLNFRLHPNELAAMVATLSPAVLFFGPEFAGAVAEVRERCPSLRHLVQLDGEGLPGSHGYAEVLASVSAAPVERARVDAEEILCLLGTGGTTGTPKAARISYRMVAWNTLNTAIHELREGDVTVTHTPMFHTGGLLVYTLPLLTLGGTVVLMRHWDPEQMLALIPTERVSLFFCVPTQYQDLLRQPRFAETDFSRVRFLTSGGAPLPITLLEAWQEVHPTPFKQGFGMTEFGPGIFSMAPEHARAKAGSVGRPNHFVDARVVDAENRPLLSGEIGEMVLRGPAMFSGYFGRSAEESGVDADGWFHTGDLARVDADGFWFVVGRKKEMFISGGENVYPLEIEEALYSHPAVQQCAVVGVPDARWGEVGHAAVVLKAAVRATPEELLAHLRTRLARYKVPKSLELMDALPLSPAGKVLKQALRERAGRAS